MLPAGGPVRHATFSRRRSLAIAVALVATLTPGCGPSDEGGGGATGRFGGLHTAVCRAADQAGAGRAEEAQRTFDDVHGGLHDLAAAAEEEDRAVAARLLEAKQRVEAGGGADALEGLVGPVAAAIEVTGGSAPDGCP